MSQSCAFRRGAFVYDGECLLRQSFSSFRRALFCSEILLTLLFGTTVESKAGDGLTIARSSFAIGVAEDKSCKSIGQTFRMSSGSPLYFWTQVQGTSAALATLRSKHALPIQHVWSLVVGTDSLGARSIPLEVGNPETIDKLELEVGKQKFFDWRTWSHKIWLVPGIWQVRVTDSAFHPLSCGETNPECVFEIEVER
jgi:hypothetical protein